MSRLLTVNVAELLARPGRRRRLQRRAPVAEVAPEGLAVLDAVITPAAEARVDVELESLTDGLVATGRVEAPWTAHCRRCLVAVSGVASSEVRELFRGNAGPDDDAFPLAGEQVDLAPMVREALLLELPLAPLCRADCAGLCTECGADRNQGDCGCATPVSDPRWAALDALLAEPDDRP